MSIGSHYRVSRFRDGSKLKFYFNSIGENTLPKVIIFSPIDMQMFGRPVYNLGFGDEEIAGEEVMDTVVSNNGDVYRVFNTVLSTVPVFFEEHYGAAIQVRGSDGIEDFFEHCIVHCNRSCITRCRKEGRRMSVYRRFVCKYYDRLMVDYIILGGIDAGRSGISWERFCVQDRLYDAILIFQKNKTIKT